MSKCSRSSRLTGAKGARPTQLQPRLNSLSLVRDAARSLAASLRNSEDQLGAAPLTKSKIRDR